MTDYYNEETQLEGVKEMKKVVKFGGSSLANADQFKKVGAIISEDESRRYVVPSAPGKRFASDIKVTDMLYACYEAQNSLSRSKSAIRRSSTGWIFPFHWIKILKRSAKISAVRRERTMLRPAANS